MRALLVVALLLAVFVGSADAWWCTGHMAIAKIAKLTMSDRAVEKLETIISTLAREGPFKKSPDMVQVACWADDLKSSGLDPMASWHFINRPYDPSGFPIKENPMQKENVESVIMQLDKAVKRNDRDMESWILGFAVANLIHFYGDIHQPLHVTEMFSSTYPRGDAGGNAQTVHVDGTTTRLHFIWDSICWEYNQELERPLNEHDTKIVDDLAKRLMQTYTFTDAQKKEYNSTVMSLEGYEAAIKVAYPGTYDGMTITQDYLKKCLPVAESRVALAGWRLGSQLEYFFGRYQDNHLELSKAILRHLAESRVNMKNSELASRIALLRQQKKL